jgi:predicted dehydrogenase
MDNATILGVADIDPHRLKQVAQRFGVEHCYKDFNQLLANPYVDAVVVSVPDEFHASIAKTVLEAEKHLVLDKPLADSLEEGFQLIELHRTSSRLAMVAFHLRWHRLLQRAKELIRRGSLGRLKMIRSTYTSEFLHPPNEQRWRAYLERGGGMLFRCAPHHVDLWRFFCECEVDAVYAVRAPKAANDDSVTITARMANEVLTSVTLASRTGSTHDFEVFGTKGSLRVSCLCFDGLRLFPNSFRPGDPRTRLQGITNTLRELPRALLRGGRNDYDDSFQRMWSHFIDCVWQDGTPACTLTDGLRALEVIHAAAQSLAERKPVKITAAPNRVCPEK